MSSQGQLPTFKIVKRHPGIKTLSDYSRPFHLANIMPGYERMILDKYTHDLDLSSEPPEVELVVVTGEELGFSKGVISVEA